MEIDLTYDGLLPASGNGKPSDEKLKNLWAMRREFQAQLRHLYDENPVLRGEGGAEARAFSRIVRAPIEKEGRIYWALVSNRAKLKCSLEIGVLLNEDLPSVIRQSGDLDNRVKSIIDSLRLPGKYQEIQKYGPSAEEQPFICLMEDDALVSGLNLTAGRLLKPNTPAQWAKVSVHVKVKIAEKTFENSAL